MSPAGNGSPKRVSQSCAVHTCSMPATSATWSSWTRVRCQTSHAIEFASASRRAVSCSAVSPSTASCTTSRIRSNPSASRSATFIGCLLSSPACYPILHVGKRNPLAAEELVEEGAIAAAHDTQVLGRRFALLPLGFQLATVLGEGVRQGADHRGDQLVGVADRLVRIVHEAGLDGVPPLPEFTGLVSAEQR